MLRLERACGYIPRVTPGRAGPLVIAAQALSPRARRGKAFRNDQPPNRGSPTGRPPVVVSRTVDAKNRAAGAPRGRRTRARAGVGPTVSTEARAPSGRGAT